ncbi:hypothetical protein FH972_024497 [Carpinus fangiana]|uniref:Protein kinase domain-containing protein n=1 Tax=Carpinus fangiana TaxID=176857 RepID=A0A5N6KYX9_9ROSI|nr:hypothetical protein FH972_024497 [Carpinus fangiana]
MTRISERRGSSAGSISSVRSITGSIRRHTSTYLSKVKKTASQLISNASNREGRSLTAFAGNVFTTRSDLSSTTSKSASRTKSQLAEAEADFYRRWIVISRAGSGGQFDVFFVISRKWFDSEAWTVVDRANRHNGASDRFKFDVGAARKRDGTFVSLTEGVHVAKIPNPSIQNRETTRLMEEMGITDCSDFEALRVLREESMYTPHLIDWDQKTEAPMWTVQEAFNCGTLFDLSVRWTSLQGESYPWPEAFIWHVFIELTLALHYIHCAGVAHCDLVAFNVCLHIPKQDLDNALFPRVVPIDFGRAKTREHMEGALCKWDMTRLGNMVHEMVHNLPFAGGEGEGADHGPRDPNSGICSCKDPFATHERQLSPRGQTLYREIMRYTATASPKTVDDIVVRLVPHAKTARKHTFARFPGQIWQRMLTQHFPSEEQIWAKMKAQEKT